MDRRIGVGLLRVLAGCFPVLYVGSLFVPTNTPDPGWIIPFEFLTLSLIAGALFRISGELSESQLSGSYVWSVVLWTGLGIVVADGLVLLYFGHLWVEGQLLPADELADLLLFAAAWGSTSSAYMAVQRARARRRFEQVSDQRDEFAFLNSILRHNVLNSINIIQGTATTLAETATEQDQHQLAIIERQSDNVATLIEQVRQVSDIQTGSTETTSLALAPLVEEAVETARATYPDAEFDTEIPAGISIQGTPLLSAAFDNVLDNAVEHNDATPPEISVTATDRGETVSIEISDNGPGLPAEIDSERLFDKESYSDSFGLHVVQEIVEATGGGVTARQNEPRGLVVEIELLKADADTSSPAVELRQS